MTSIRDFVYYIIFCSFKVENFSNAPTNLIIESNLRGREVSLLQYPLKIRHSPLKAKNFQCMEKRKRRFRTFFNEKYIRNYNALPEESKHKMQGRDEVSHSEKLSELFTNQWLIGSHAYAKNYR